MPLIFRSMLADGGKPMIGTRSKALGVRVPTDISPDAQGRVAPGTGGMSVVSAWRLLLPHLIPRRLRPLVPHAAGTNALVCWRMDDGTFVAGPLAPGLFFRPDPWDPHRHGFVEPEREMDLGDYQAALAATVELWVMDEA